MDTRPIDRKLLFRGADCYERLANSKDLDLIQISTPQYFHVHLEAAIASGKHVYCEKSVGVDIAQAKRALKIAQRVKPNQSVDAGFHVATRHPSPLSRRKSGQVRLEELLPLAAITTPRVY